MATKTPRKKKAPTSPNVFEAGIAPAPELKTDAQVQGAINHALEGPTASEGMEVRVGNRPFIITFLPYGVERQMNRIIGPYLQFLLGAWLEGGEAFAKALSVAIAESDEDLTELALVILRAYDESINEDWLNRQARFHEVMDLIKAQLEVNKVADSLGKLWGNGVLSAGLAEALTITTPPAGPTSTRSSSAPVSATSSTPPKS